MISKTFRIGLMIVIASLALSSAAEAATCSNASLSGTYGFVTGGTNIDGAPNVHVSQLTFDSATGTYTGESTASEGGAIITTSLTATYAVASNCTVTATVTTGGQSQNLAFVVTPAGFLAVDQKTGVTSQGFGVKQGSPICTNAGVEGSFGFEATGVLVAGAPVTGPVAFIGELKLTVDPSGEGVIGGHVAGSEDGTILTFAEEPVTGSYTVDTDCRGRATIRLKGLSEMHFSLVVVDCGKEMLAIETDTNTVVSGTLVKGRDEMEEGLPANANNTDSVTGRGADSAMARSPLGSGS